MATEAVIVTGVVPDVTSTTNDWTASGFGTPTAAVVFMTGANVTSNPDANAVIGIGFHDGTNDYGVGTWSEDNQATTDADRKNSDDRSLIHMGTNTTDADAAFITDGIQVTTRTNGPTLEDDAYGMALLFKGTTNVKAIKQLLGTGTSAIDITSVGFKPDVVFAITCGYGSVGDTSQAIMSFGVAHNDSADSITQAYAQWASRNGVGAGDIYHDVSASKIGGSSDVVGGNAWTITVSDFDASGFSVTPSANAANDLVYFLCIKLADPDDAYVAVIDSATATGTQAYTGTGFTPGAALLAGSTNTAVDTVQQTGGYFVGLADGTRSRGLSIFDEDAAGTTNTGSEMTTGLLKCLLDDGTADAVATLSSMDSNGFTLNYSDGSTSASKWMAFAVGDSTATPVGGFTTALGTKAIGDQAQISGLISALDVLSKAGLVQSTGLVTVLDALASTGQAAVTGHGTNFDALTKLGFSASFPGVAGFATVLEALTAAGQAAATGHGTVLDALTASGLPQNLGAVGEFTTVLDSLSASGQAAAIGLITALDALSVTERAQALGFITSVGTETVTEYQQNFGGSGFTTNLATLSTATLDAGMTIWQLGDLMARAYADLPVFFDSFGFAETVTVGTATVRGIFDDQSAPGGSMEGPLVVLKTGDVTGLGIDQGTEITIRGRSFYAAGVQRDGVGTATVILRELF